LFAAIFINPGYKPGKAIVGMIPFRGQSILSETGKRMAPGGAGFFAFSSGNKPPASRKPMQGDRLHFSPVPHFLGGNAGPTIREVTASLPAMAT
jgi:hypothetical protein